MAKKSKKQKANSGVELSRNTVAVAALGLIIVIAGLLAISGALTGGEAVAEFDPEVAGVATIDSPQRISPENYQSYFAQGDTEYVLIDVRTPSEFSSGHIANSINIPVEQLQSRIAEVPQGMPVVVYCRSGNRSADAARILDAGGFAEVYDLGGTIGWTSSGYPLEN